MHAFQILPCLSQAIENLDSGVEILDKFRSEVSAMASGERGMEESRRMIQDYLTGIGYCPSDRDRGTIRDLGSASCIHILLRTNVNLVHGFRSKESGLRGSAAVPCWELARFERRLKVRNWKLRFTLAGGYVLPDGRMIAPKNSTVWERLGSIGRDSLGFDYPPFAWRSGMGWIGVPFAECKALGVLPPCWKPPLLKSVPR